MKYIRQILLILLFSFLGELLHQLIPMPIPASIYGMVLLFAALSLRIVKPAQIKESADFLVSVLPLLFVAPVVSLMDCWDVLRPKLVPILVILTVSTALCFAISGLVPQWLQRKGGSK